MERVRGSHREHRGRDKAKSVQKENSQMTFMGAALTFKPVNIFITCVNVVATETKFGILSQCPSAANDASPGLVSWWHCGLDTWLDLFFLFWVRIVNAHKSKLFHICIRQLRI